MMGTSTPDQDVGRRRAEEDEETLTGSSSKKTPPKKTPVSDRWNHYTFKPVLAVLARGTAGRCEIEHHTALAAETARRLCCDGGIVGTVDGPRGEPLSVGRRTRSIPPALRRALMSRDRGCRFPGCPSTYRLHGHHVRHWAEGGETALDNLVLLCPVHHRLVHEGGFDVRRFDDGALRFTDPNGEAVRAPAPREASSPDNVAAQNNALGLVIDSETAMAHWHGERIDYDHAVMVTMHAWSSEGSLPGTAPPEVHEAPPVRA